MNDKRKIRITIDEKGGYKFEAMEGFNGESCIGKKDDYYNGDSPENVFVNL